jgi:hypothetical protein
MTATRSADDESPQAIPARAGAPEAGGSLLETSVVANQCDVCAADLAPDQRYCVECGTRRGKPRFALQPAGREEAVVERHTGGGRLSTMALLACIAMVLLALGVGFLIGKSASKASPVHVVVTTGATTPTSSSSSGAGGSSGSAASSGSNTHSKGSGSHSSSTSSTTPSNGGNFFGGGG